MATFPQDDLVENLQLARTNNIQKYCSIANCLKQIQYVPLQTGGNDPSITKAMRFSQYVRNRRQNASTVITGNTGNVSTITTGYGNNSGGTSIFTFQSHIF